MPELESVRPSGKWGPWFFREADVFKYKQSTKETMRETQQDLIEVLKG